MIAFVLVGVLGPTFAPHNELEQHIEALFKLEPALVDKLKDVLK